MVSTYTMTTQPTESTAGVEALLRLIIEFADNNKTTTSFLSDLLLLLSKILQSGLIFHDSERTETLTFREAAQKSFEARLCRRPSTIKDLSSYINRFLKYADWTDRDIRTITQRDCRNLLNAHFKTSGHVFCKAKSILHSIFNYAIRRECCDKNPVRGIDSLPIREEKINILTLKQIAGFMKAVKANDLQCMQAAIRLMLWCGIRPGEVQRLRWQDVDFRENVVYIDGQTSKTGGARAVPLRGSALYLKQFKGKLNDYIAPRNWARVWEKLRRRAGMRQWQKDAMRHTFASMHLKRFHNIYLLQEEMGHRDSMLLRTRYLNLRGLTSQAAARFFNWPE